MTDYSVNRPGDSPLSPGGMEHPYPRFRSQMGLGPFPADYVGALSGALSQLDISAMVSLVVLETRRLERNPCY